MKNNTILVGAVVIALVAVVLYCRKKAEKEGFANDAALGIMGGVFGVVVVLCVVTYAVLKYQGRW